jgi:hypothetical protein
MKNKLIWILIPLLIAINIFFKINITRDSSFSGYTNLFNFIEAWHHQSPSECYFSATNSFENVGDKYVQYWPGLVDLQGNCYYTSFPPFSFQVCYFVWWLTNFSQPELVFFYFNILLNVLVALFCMLAVSNILLKLNYKKYELPAIFCFASILFTPITFWFFTDYFFIENIALLVLSVCIYLFTKYDIKPTKLNFGALLISVCLLCYTEAIGYFFAITLFIYLYHQHKKLFTKQSVVLLASALAVIGFTVFQYALIQQSFIAVLHNFAVRFIGRSGYFGESKTENHLGVFTPEIYLYLWHLLKVGMLALLLLFIALIISFIARIKSNELSKQIIKHSFWWYIPFPVILHFFIFFNANALHDQLIVKLVIPLSILSAIIIGIFSSAKISRWIFYGCLGLAISIFYYPVMMAESMSDDGVKEASARFLKFASPQKSMIIICNKDQYYLAPSLYYHSKRNYFLLTDSNLIDDAKARLIVDSSIVFTVDANWNILHQKVISNR